MKVFQMILVLSIVIGQLPMTNTKLILKALKTAHRPKQHTGSEDHHPHRHQHGQHHHRRRRRKGESDNGNRSDPSSLDPQEQLLQREMEAGMGLGMDGGFNRAAFSSRVILSQSKPQLPPLELQVNIESSSRYLADSKVPERLEDEEADSRSSQGTDEYATSLHIKSDSVLIEGKQLDKSSPIPKPKPSTQSSTLSGDDEGSGAIGDTDITGGSLGESSSEGIYANLHLAAGDSSETSKTGRSRRSLTKSSPASAAEFNVKVPVCEAVSEWVERHAAEDMWGNTVRVLQEIDIGGVRVHQYFYETHCRERKASCLGIDTSRYRSECRNKHMWAYAKIQTQSGDTGWNLIKIRSSCNCALYSRTPFELFTRFRN